MFPDILQELMKIKEPPNRLAHDVNNNWYLSNKLRPDEWLLINNVTTKGYADFDIPFIYKLVRNLKLLLPPTQGWDHSNAPCSNEITAGDDLERIRRLRNEILHRGNAQVNDTELSQFFTQFKDIAGRFETYLGKQTGDFVDKFIDLETCCIDEETRNMYIKRLDGLRKNDEDCKKRLNALEEDVDALKETSFQLIHTKLEELALAKDEVIPKNILEQFERRLEQWKVEDQMFVSTGAEKHLMKYIFTESCVTIVGNSGTGKSFLSRHVALKMMDQGYIIIPCDSPGDVRQWFKHGRNTLFIFDDVCGHKCCKILSTCRQEVYRDEQFNSLCIFKRCIIDLSSQEFRLNSAEQSALADMYFHENTDKVKELSEKYDFFPLLCSLYRKQILQKHVNLRSFFSNPFGVFKGELNNLYLEGDDGKMKYCCLVLCVMLNNSLTEENVSSKGKEIEAVIKSLLHKCELNKGINIERLSKSLATLEGTYVTRERGTYKIIHDKLFDFLAKYFGDKLQPLLIGHANTCFISERFIWKTSENLNTDIEFTIRIHDSQINRYIERLLKDWASGSVRSVFGNRNMRSPAFTEKFISCINKLEYSKQEELALTKDTTSKDIALAECCYYGFVDLVKWLISRNSDINYCTEDGYFPLLWASQEGQVDVVKELLQHSADVNQCDNNDVSPLYIASEEGHVDVVKELLQHSADINKCCDEGESPLLKASQNGHVNVVKELLLHSADVNKCSDAGESPLWMASQEGHYTVFKALLRNSAHVNICNNEGESSLWIASQNGHLNIVNELLHIKDLANVNKSSNDGGSPLWIASLKGHINIVKVLLQHSANVNRCFNRNVSPLLIASQNGHVNVVKELLQHSAKINKCMNDGSTPLIRASHSNRIGVVKTLLRRGDVDINFCDKNGRSALYCASHQGHVYVIKELLKHSADTNKCDFRGVSPLRIARRNGHVNVINELLHYSAKANKFNTDHCTRHKTNREASFSNCKSDYILY
ncbi:unnamed protein product [Mytilus coruscus]|uniref:Uncharacterized protein n=1 Tax=Mytilus coruscus TaxID=42192 RepID=A0A6J8B5M5_MYTCO|nr:unnamed protein product [Mytilus coruscus]